MLGPNCLGVYDAAASLDLGTNEFTPGGLGVISQSGNLALELSLLGAQYGIGISRFASLGNQADIEAAELVEALAADEHTRVIGVYCEDFRDGRAFARAGEAALRAGKQVVLLAAGGSEAGARAAASHTGALASDSAAVEAACRAAGILRVTTPKQLIDCALACLAPHRPAGRRVAIVGDGGGTGVVTADLVTEAGLELPRLSAGLAARLTAIAPTIVTANPVDLAGAGEQDFWNFERVTTEVLESGEVDAVIFTGYFGGYSQMNEAFSAIETEVGQRDRTGGDGERPAAARAGDVLGLSAGSGAARGRRSGLPRHRGGRRHARAARRGRGHGGNGRARRRRHGWAGRWRRLLRGARAARGGRDPVRRRPPRRIGGRGTYRCRRARLSGRAEGARAAAQVGCGRRRTRPRRRRGGGRGGRATCASGSRRRATRSSRSSTARAASS